MSNTFLSDYCPFCGSKSYELQRDNNNYYFIHCKSCGCETGHYLSEELAMGAWENRVKLDLCLYRDLEKKVIEWANDKNLINAENALKQFEKVKEEVSELEIEINKNDYFAIQDELGDVVVTLIILSKQLDLTLEGCLLMAYNKIKNRKGKTINGTFVKES